MSQTYLQAINALNRAVPSGSVDLLEVRQPGGNTWEIIFSWHRVTYSLSSHLHMSEVREGGEILGFTDRSELLLELFKREAHHASDG